MSDGFFIGQLSDGSKLTPLLESESTIDEYLVIIKENLLWKEKTIEYWQKRAEAAENTAYASEEMQKMKAELEQVKKDLYRGFPISEKESKAISEWKKKHDAIEHKNFNSYHGAAGGGYIYEFYPTGLGTSGVCICPLCRRRALNEAYAKGNYDEKVYHKYIKKHNGEFEFQELG